MKKILLPGFLFLTLISKDTLASGHIRLNIKCKSKIHYLESRGTYIESGYDISLAGQNEKFFKASDVVFSDNLNNDDVIFSTISSRTLKIYKPKKVCGSSFERKVTKTTLKINLISDDASKELGLKQDDKITLTCYESVEYPNDSDCG